MATYPRLPEDVVSVILLELPVKTLLRFRCVCKSWQALIDNSSFINQHVHHDDRNNISGTFIIPDRDGSTWCVLSGNQFDVSVNLDLRTCFPPLMEDPLWTPLYLVASCNGILCLCTSRKEQIALWNPARKQITRLPELPLLPRSWVQLGFGYDVKNNDYKVVRITVFLTESSSPSSYLVQVYCLRTDSWRAIDPDIPVGPHIYSDSVYLHGHYCWILVHSADSYDNFLSFDFSNEVFGFFGIITRPDDESAKKPIPYLSVISDSLAFVSMYEIDTTIDVWLMKVYGVFESWTKIFTISLIPLRSLRFLGLKGFSKNGEFLLLSHLTESGFRLLLSDTKTQEIKHLQVKYKKVAIYRESLVSIKINRASELEKLFEIPRRFNARENKNHLVNTAVRDLETIKKASDSKVETPAEFPSASSTMTIEETKNLHAKIQGGDCNESAVSVEKEGFTEIGKRKRIAPKKLLQCLQVRSRSPKKGERPLQHLSALYE